MLTKRDHRAMAVARCHRARPIVEIAYRECVAVDVHIDLWRRTVRSAGHVPRRRMGSLHSPRERAVTSGFGHYSLRLPAKEQTSE